MHTSTDHLVGVSELARNTSTVVNRASNGERLVILKNNVPAAIIMDVASAKRAEQLEELEEDFRLLAASLIRITTDTGARHDLDDVISELGIELGPDETE